MRWVWNGVLSLDVPEGWEVRNQDDVIEIVPPKPVGAVHISVLRRTRPNEVQDGEAALLAADFARKRGVGDPRPSETRHGGGRLARIAFQSVGEARALTWDVEARVWGGRALVCSYCHDGRDAWAREAALLMFASIEPHAAPV